jgi:anti-sigma B factor antagonist
MDEARRTLLAELQELSLEAAVERLIETGVLDAGTLHSYRDEQLREWRGRSLAQLGDELEALRRQARQQRRHAAAQVQEARRQRELAGAARETIIQLDERRRELARSRATAREETAALDLAERALGAALAVFALLNRREPYSPEADIGTGLEVEERRVDARVVLRLEGEIDIATAPRLRDSLAAAIASGATEVWVDLAGVRFIDSTGISALLCASEELPAPRRLAVICPDGPARRALELCGIGKVLSLYADRSSAGRPR